MNPTPLSDEWREKFLSATMKEKEKMLADLKTLTKRKKRSKKKSKPDPLYNMEKLPVITPEKFLRDPVSSPHPLASKCPHCLEDVVWQEFACRIKIVRQGHHVFRCPECGFTATIQASRTCSMGCKCIDGRCFKRHVPLGLNIPKDWYKKHPLDELTIENNLIPPCYRPCNTTTYKELM